MCGIIGVYSKTINRQLFTDALKTLYHRGPDASDIFISGECFLGHTRLSIIDLSIAANQPMISDDKRYTIIYNGEVYNFKELAQQYQLHLKTQSDTEVILELYKKIGKDILTELNGMFAFCIYDNQTHQFFIARDRMGVKPLFYYYDGNSFAFASEIKALVKLPFIKKELNEQIIPTYLHLGYIPEPHTIYKNIFKFPSGCYAVFSKNTFNTFTYWKLEDKYDVETLSDEKTAKEKLHALLQSSIQYRMIADVPYGTFLSGGTDSSLVTAIAKQHNSNIQTFTIGFKETQYNEAPYAKAIAKYLNTNHREYILSYQDAINLIPEIIDTYDEPYADASAIPTMLLSKITKQNVKMILSGDGGDELFMGYGAYKWAQRLHNPFIKILNPLLSNILKYGNTRMQRAALLLNYRHSNNIMSHIFSQEQYFFSEKEIEYYLLSQANKITLSSVAYHQYSRKLLPEEYQSLFDIKYYLKDDLLVKTDRASMKYGLEIREPLLDYRIVEFAINLNKSLKIKSGCQKYLLKEILYEYIPKEFFNRPKWGFSIPVKKWLQHELSYLIEDYLSEQEIKKHGIFNHHSISKLIQEYKSGKDYLYNRIWALIIFQQFMKKNFE